MMKTIFENLKIVLDNNQYEKFSLYKDLLIQYNKKFNITAITDEVEIIHKHFVDSLMGEGYLSTNAKIIEIGSGGGFPSIPLKILRNDLDFTLVESTNKKCEFLKIVIKELQLDNVRVVCDRAEVLAKNNDFREKFDFSVARAVARLNTLCEYCLPFVKVGGSFVAYKGNSQDEINEGLNAIKILGGAIKKIDNYELDYVGHRSIVVIEKKLNTPQKYPRGLGKERSKPL